MIERPISLRSGVILPNRAALAPMTNTQSHEDGALSDDEQRWLLRRAEGGFGLVSTCAAMVCEEGKAWSGQLGVHRDDLVPALMRWATALRATGCVPIVQLHHGGSAAALAPGLRLSTVDGDGVRGATREDLQRVTTAFADAARRCEAAGFAGVEIHGANGYLFTQFLAPKTNTRADAYGGEIEGRARFLRETLRAVRAATSPGFAVGVRISPVDIGAPRGLVLADAVALAGWLVEDGMDFLHLSLADCAGSPPHEVTDVPVARTLRQCMPSEVPLVAAGGVWTAADVARAFAAGVDVIAVGKAAIGHPDWPRRALDPAWRPRPMPWTPEYLHSVDVSPTLLTYLKRFPGMVVGGRPARD